MFRTYGKNKKAILLLKADEFLRDRSIVAALRSFDGMIIGMSINPNKTPSRIFDYVIDADPHKGLEALAAIKKFIRKTNISFKAIIPITEMTLIPGFIISRELDLPYLNEFSVNASRDKNLMKKALNNYNVPTAKHYIINDLNELKNRCKQLGFPTIIKPTSAAHSIGIKLIRNEDEIEAVYNYCKNSLQVVSEEWGLEKLSFQVEEFIESSKEISVEIINTKCERKVISITDKSLSPLPYFTETGHMVPSTEYNNIEIREVALNACAALKLNHGVAHVEIRLTDNGKPMVIEVAARPGGDGIMDLVERSHGINLYELHIKSYLNTLSNIEDIEINNYGTSAMVFFPKKVGTIKSIDYSVSLPKEVMSLYISLKEGDSIIDSENYDTRLGTIELFWDKITSGLEGKHLEIASELLDNIFTIENEKIKETL